MIYLPLHHISPSLPPQEEKLPHSSLSSSSATGSDITHCDTPAQPDSASTASFDTACEEAPPTCPAPPVVMVTDAQKAAVLQQEEGMEAGSLASRKRRTAGVPSLPAPLVLPTPLKGRGEAPPPVLTQEEGGNKSQQKVAFPGNSQEKKRRGKEKKKGVASLCTVAASQRRAPDDVR